MALTPDEEKTWRTQQIARAEIKQLQANLAALNADLDHINTTIATEREAAAQAVDKRYADAKNALVSDITALNVQIADIEASL